MVVLSIHPLPSAVKNYIMDAECHDQKACLVLKGLKAYVQQMNNNPESKSTHRMLNRPKRPAMHILRRPRIDHNFNELWKNDNSPPTDSEKDEVFKEVENDLAIAEKEKQRILESCVCLREVSLIHCRYCGYHCKGRIQKSCKAHPNVTFLMDISQCPQCKTYEIKEYPLPEGY